MTNNKQSSDHIPDVGKKVSSVEWLVSQLKISTYWNNLISELELMECGEIDILEQAKAMHKEEIKNACQEFLDTTLPDEVINDYYNETFGGKND